MQTAASAAHIIPRALDPALSRIFRSPLDSASDYPLAIRRFLSCMHAQHPTGAMEQAATSLLDKYVSVHADLLEPVSVERLCSVAEVDLTGMRPVRRSSPVLHVGSPVRNGPTGFLDFTQMRPLIRIPPNIEFERARVTVAHEIAHVLIHKREHGHDDATVRLGSSDVEEAIAEYGARLLLMPVRLNLSPASDENLAVWSVRKARRARVTVYAALARLGDPDMQNREVRGAILWRPRSDSLDSTYESLSPYWHLCSDTFVPIGRCKARRGSLVSELAAHSGQLASTSIEQVHIGSLEGHFRVDAFAWGEGNARVVLSVFRIDGTSASPVGGKSSAEQSFSGSEE